MDQIPAFPCSKASFHVLYPSRPATRFPAAAVSFMALFRAHAEIRQTATRHGVRTFMMKLAQPPLPILEPWPDPIEDVHRGNPPMKRLAARRRARAVKVGAS